MKVITIGRSKENDVVLRDNNVSRHHCQIVQYDNGAFGIVDLGSTNGTFVNGTRVQGQTPLKRGDRVLVAQTELNWQQHFPQKTQKHSHSWLWPTIAATIAIAVLTAVAIFVIESNSNKAFPFEGIYPEAVAVELVNDKGYSYTVEAIEGQVCIWFNDISVKDARKCIKHLGGEIIAQIPDIGYYLVKVPANDVQHFLTEIQGVSGIERAFPNMVSYSCMANTYILDNYYPDMSQNDTTPHGVIVQYALQEYGTESPLKTYNIGSIDGKYMCTSERMNERCANNAVFALDSIATSLVDNQPIIINMSFGPYLRPRKNGEKYYWDSATDEERLDYQERFKNHIQNVIKIVKPLEGKDFIVTKSAGNNGVKDFDAAIIAYLENNLSPEEKEVLDKHFLLVTAGEKEDINKNYSNEMEKGHYHPWVTEVDISDFRYNGKKRRGTSFAAPRAAGFISLVANKYDLTASDVLKYARKATEKSPNHLLTQKALENEIKNNLNRDNSPTKPTNSGYLTYGCLKYRLVKDKETNEERLELHNTCDDDIRVTGTLLNTIAPHGGDNTLDFETIVKANRTEYVDGFVENDCTIKSVEKMTRNQPRLTPSSGVSSQQGISACLVGTTWTATDFGEKNTISFLDNNKVRFTTEYLYWGEPQSGLLDYYYDQKRDWIIIIAPAPVQIIKKRLRLKNGRLKEVNWYIFEDKESDGIEYERLR